MSRENAIHCVQQGALLTLFGWNCILFSVALRRNFSRPDGVPLMMRALAFCGLLATLTDVVLLVSIQPILWQSVLAGGVLVLSQLLFRSSVRATSKYKLSLAFSDDTPVYLNQSGPYRFIRHPFYTAYALNWIGVAMATAHIAAIIGSLVMATLYWYAARKEENKFLHSPLGPSYRDYKHFTGMFFPCLTTKSKYERRN